MPLSFWLILVLLAKLQQRYNYDKTFAYQITISENVLKKSKLMIALTSLRHAHIPFPLVRLLDKLWKSLQSVLANIFFADINECASSPCLNGGACADQINGYVCTCLTGYAGTNCETGKWVIKNNI